MPIIRRDFSLPKTHVGLIIDYQCDSQSDNAAVQSKLCELSGQFLDVCQVRHEFECHPYDIYCFLSFERYNIRVLVDALKQQLVNLTNRRCPINIYYTDYLKSGEDVRQQLDYMAKHLDYSLLYGYMIRFSYAFIHNSEQNEEALMADPNQISVLLEKKDYEGLIRYIEQQRAKIMGFKHMVRAPYSSHEVYLFMETMLYVLKFHFQANLWKSPINDATLPEFLRQRPGINEYCAFVESCITEFEAVTKPGPGGRRPQFMDSLLRHIEQNLSTVTLGALAEHFHLNNAYLSRAFKKYTGENFSEYVASRKLYRATLMLTQDISIHDISVQLGYSSPTYFLAKFKEKYGMTPSAYRRKYQVYELLPDRFDTTVEETED